MKRDFEGNEFDFKKDKAKIKFINSQMILRNAWFSDAPVFNREGKSSVTLVASEASGCPVLSDPLREAQVEASEPRGET